MNSPPFEPSPMVRVLLSDLESLGSENARLRRRVDELQSRMSEMVVERQAFSMIWQHEEALRMCFPYGIEAEEARGNGRACRLSIERREED